MAAVYNSILIALFLGFVYANAPRHAGPAFVEDMRQAAGSRIVAGWPAEDGQIPHQISLRMVNGTGSVSSCGGSIISAQWIITAAHCVANRFTFVVRLGLTNLTRPEYIVETTDKHIHPNYIEATAGVQTDDIALLGLEQAILFGPTIQPIRLQSSAQRNDDYTGVTLVASGYGRTDDLWNGGATSEILRWVFLRGISNAECRTWYTSGVVQDQTVCSEFYNDTAQSTCQGDSGGPLTFIDTDGQLTEIGIVSFGSSAGCNSPWPSAYVRPGHYHDWYVEVTGLSFDGAIPSDNAAMDDAAMDSKVVVVESAAVDGSRVMVVDN